MDQRVTTVVSPKSTMDSGDEERHPPGLSVGMLRQALGGDDEAEQRARCESEVSQLSAATSAATSRASHLSVDASHLGLSDRYRIPSSPVSIRSMSTHGSVYYPMVTMASQKSVIFRHRTTNETISLPQRPRSSGCRFVGRIATRTASDPALGQTLSKERLWREDSGGSSSSDMEIQQDDLAIIIQPQRRGAVCTEVYGAHNPHQAAWKPAFFEKSPDHEKILREALRRNPFFSQLKTEALLNLVNCMPMTVYKDGERIITQGDIGDTGFVILSGNACVTQNNMPQKELRPRAGTVQTTRSAKRAGDHRFVRTMPVGRFFGEISMLWNHPRSCSVSADGECQCAVITRQTYQSLVVQQMRNERNRRDECLRSVGMLETLNDEQIAQISDALVLKTYKPGEVIVRQGDVGSEFFVVLDGECIVTIKEYDDVQEHRRYKKGDLFGERALLARTERAATVTASKNSRVEVAVLRRSAFERMLGSLSQLQRQNYQDDPRKRIATFFNQGDERGPLGVGQADKVPFEPREMVGGASNWFAVLRPTSRDAIAKMLGGFAVGKAMNVKGKSAKKNVLSGFVPFLQISVNSHKDKVDPAPGYSRVCIFYNSATDRDHVLQLLERLLHDEQLDIDNRIMSRDDSYPGKFGLDMPEAILQEAYIHRPDISPRPDWETGRVSEPSFMNMNLKSLREFSLPRVVLYQFDPSDPMNSQGLLIAYAERMIKPVVSDFDLFTIGSKGGFNYRQLPPDQVELAKFALSTSESILAEPSPSSWSTRWLDHLKRHQVEPPDMPSYGYCDPSTQVLVEEIVQATARTGAVRHSAECFNFFFAQELDTDYLIVWDAFKKMGDGKPWAYKNEDELRDFLKERIAEGFCMPLNPVWAVRDLGWYEVLQQMLAKPEFAGHMAAWYPPGSGLLERMEELHRAYPDGFCTSQGDGVSQKDRCLSAYGDLSPQERADLGVSMLANDHWRKARSKISMISLLTRGTTQRTIGTSRRSEAEKSVEQSEGEVF